MQTNTSNGFSLISLSSDFGIQSQGVGAMEAAIYSIAPNVRVIHLMHGLPEYQIITAARTLETLDTWPVGCHVCVCDPGVGTTRHALAVQVARGDFLIGPDNGVLIPATRVLGGIVKAVSVENPVYMRPDVSPIFHGRDIFAPAAAHLACGVSVDELGPQVSADALMRAPYEEATVSKGVVEATIIQINKFGSLHLNIRHEQWDSFGFELGQQILLQTDSCNGYQVTYARMFGQVPIGNPLILRDDYGRVEVAINQGRICDQLNAKIGNRIRIILPE